MDNIWLPWTTTACLCHFIGPHKLRSINTLNILHCLNDMEKKHALFQVIMHLVKLQFHSDLLTSSRYGACLRYITSQQLSNFEVHAKLS